MKRILIVALLLAPFSTSAARELLAVSRDENIVMRASEGAIAAIDPSTLAVRWSIPGVERPSSLVLSTDGRWAAAVDPLANQVAIAALASRTSRRVAVPETPVAAEFADGALFVLSRDGARLSRIDLPDGVLRSVAVDQGASHMLITPAGVIVYSALNGSAVRIDPVSLRILASGRLPRFASDLAWEGASGYLVHPGTGRLTVFSLAGFELTDERQAGAVPTDIEIESAAGPTRDARLAIADPSSKRVWRDEGAQSTAAAVGRGVLRGLLGLGLYSPDSSSFPSGIDRLVRAGGRLWAFDSSSGALYVVRGKGVAEVARGLAWGSFAPAGKDLLVARAGSIERIHLP